MLPDGYRLVCSYPYFVGSTPSPGNEPFSCHSLVSPASGDPAFQRIKKINGMEYVYEITLYYVPK